MAQDAEKEGGLLSIFYRLPALFCIWINLLVFPLAEAATAEPPESGHQSLVVVDGYFQYQAGAWAKYQIHDLKKNERSTIVFSTLERTEKEGGPAIWMEIAVTPEQQDPVITRVLLEETPQGPGQPLEIIVQPHGMTPFIIPKSFLEKAQAEPQSAIAIKPHESTAKPITIKTSKRQLSAIQVEATDEQGGPVKAVLSNEVPPLGLVRAETSDLTMKLKSFGKNAQTKIEGEPINFYLWLTLQVGKGVTGGD